MKKKIFIAAAVIISSTLQAQTVKPDSSKILSEVIVSANKFLQKQNETGKVITLITREQLEKSGGKDLSQVLTEQAGLFVNGANSNPGKDKSVYLRGGKTDHTLIAIDGVPVYDASGIGSNFDIRLIPIDNIEQIEILKGSQSTLYGSDAIGGVINIIMRKGTKKPINVDGLLSYGTYNTGHRNIVVSGATKKFDYNVSNSTLKTDGINETTNSRTLPFVDKDGYIQNSVSASVGYRPNKMIYIKPTFRYTKFKGNIDQGADLDERDYTYTSTNLQASIRNQFQFGKTQLNVIYNYNKNERTYIDDSLLSQNGYYKYSKGTYTGTEHLVDAFVIQPLGTTAKLTAGADYRQSNTDQNFNGIGLYGPDKSILSKDSLKQNQLGVYAAIAMNAKNGLSAELGGRFNHHSEYGNNVVFNFNPSFLIKQQYKLFVNISSAYKTPSLYQLFSDYGNKNLNPETATTFEGGAQYFTKNNKINARAVFFKTEVKNVIAFQSNPYPARSFYINQDKQDNYGVEFESSFQLCKSTTLKLFYAFVDGKVTTKTPLHDTTYFNLIRRPKNTFGITLGSNITKQLYISSSFNWVDKRTDFTYDAMSNKVNLELKSYGLWNIYAEYVFFHKHIHVFADFRNITNASFTEVYGFANMGFNAYAGIKFRF